MRDSCHTFDNFLIDHIWSMFCLLPSQNWSFEVKCGSAMKSLLYLRKYSVSWSRIEMRGDWRLRQHGAKIGKFLLCTFKSWIFPVNCLLFKPKFGTFAFLHVCLKCPLSLIPRSILGTLICEDKNQFNMGCNICLMFICHCPIVALACSIDLMEILFGTFLQKPKASKLFLHNFINLPISILISLCWVDWNFAPSFNQKFVATDLNFMVECLSVASEQVFGLKVREDFQLILHLQILMLFVFSCLTGF